jgi:hypothetical protein
MIYEELEEKIEHFIKDKESEIDDTPAHPESSFKIIARNLYVNLYLADGLSTEHLNGQSHEVDKIFEDNTKALRKYFELLKNEEFERYETNNKHGYLAAIGFSLKEVEKLQSNPSQYVKKVEEALRK